MLTKSVDNIELIPNDVEELPVSLKKIFFYAFVFFLLTLHHNFVILLFIILVVYSLYGISCALESMAISVIIKYANPALISFPEYFGFYVWVLLFVASVSILVRSKFRKNIIFLALIIFYFMLLFVSIWSKYPLISILKATSFCFISSAVLLGSQSLNKEEFLVIKCAYFNLFLTVLILSLPTFFIRNIGFLKNDSGFQGIFNHPQAFGIFFAPFCAWIIFKISFLKNKYCNLKYVTILCLIFFCIFMSKTRTAAISVFCSMTLTYLILIFVQYKLNKISIIKGTVFFSLFIGVFLALIFFSNDFYNSVYKFITKYESTTTFDKAFEKSRGAGSEFHIQRFLESPLVGSGFGIDYTSDFERRIVYMFGIPVSAASEKGIIYTAILEEIGLLGLMAFLFLILVLFKAALSSGYIHYFAMFVSCLAVNIGEAVFFAVGGNGLWFLLLIGLSVFKHENFYNESLNLNSK